MSEKERFNTILTVAAYTANKYLGTSHCFNLDTVAMLIDKMIKISVNELKYVWVRESAPGTVTTEAAIYRKLVSWHNQIAMQIVERNPNLVFKSFPLGSPDEDFLEELEKLLIAVSLERCYVPEFRAYESITDEEQNGVLDLITKLTGKILNKGITVMHCTIAGEKVLAGCVVCEETELYKTIRVLYADESFRNQVTEHNASKVVSTYLNPQVS